MTEKEKYYASLPDYYKLDTLRSMIISGSLSADIIKFIKEGKLSPNSYVKGLKANEWVPILNLLSKTDKNQLAVKFLIKAGANINLVPDAEPEHQEPLLFTCDPVYFKFFNEHGAKLAGDTANNIKRRLRCADINRLKLLIKTGHLNVETVKSSDPDPILFTLAAMKDYLIYAFNVRQNLTNLTEELQLTINKFLTCVLTLVEWKCPVTDAAIEFCVSYYLHEFLPLLCKDAKIEPVYHEYMDKLTVAMLRPLLNDSRYEKTCLKLHKEPCKELYQRIII